MHVTMCSASSVVREMQAKSRSETPLHTLEELTNIRKTVPSTGKDGDVRWHS